MLESVVLDLNNPTFQENLFGLPKHERHSAMETLQRLRKMTWDQVYRDHGLKWEKILNYASPKGSPVIYSLRLSQSRRATAYREGNVIKFISIASDHDSTYRRR